MDQRQDERPEGDGVLDSIRAVHGEEVTVSVNLDPGHAAPAGYAAEAALAGKSRRYTVGPEIARGGMGAILEVRDEDLRRSLAMKVLLGSGGAPGGLIRPDQLNRFLEEAQVTAQLAHPGVVPVHELGIDAAGRVFFTMSLVQGKTLSEIVSSARAGRDGWSVTRALHVILRVCETMAFAHDKGVIHRDLKPDNVMVGRFGETYVMDWGLAKVLGQEDRHDIRLRHATPSMPSLIESRRTESSSAHDSPLVTMDGAVIGTPAYMSPEQARGETDDVDARSDVYAIGALLHELLTGRPPYVERGTKLTPHVILAAVHMGPPKSVSEVSPEAPEELVAICEKAMSRDKEQRYADAEALSDDLQRFLSGRVVLAHKTGALIEFRKWVQRNRKAAATAAAALVAIAGISAAFMVSLSTQRDRAEDAELSEAKRADEAERERRRAEELAEFMLVDLRDGLTPIGRLDLLEKVARRSQEYYAGLPEIDVTPERQSERAVALTNVGEVQMLLGDLPAARRSYESALEIMRRLTDSDGSRVHWQSQLSSTHARVGAVSNAQGHLDEARENFLSSVAIQQRLVDAAPEDPELRSELAGRHDEFGEFLRACGRSEEALGSFEASLAIRERLSRADPDDPRWLRRLSLSQVRVGDIWSVQGRMDDAGALYDAALDIRQRLSDSSPDDTTLIDELTTAHGRVGNIHKARGDLPQALASYERQLSIKRRLCELEPRNTTWLRELSVSHNKVADVRRAQGRPQDALSSYAAALTIRERLTELDPTNREWQRDLALSHTRIGNIHKSAGRLPEASACFTAALGIRRKLCEAEPENAKWQRDLGTSYHKLGDVLRAEGRLDDAIASYESSVEIALRSSLEAPSDVERLRALSVSHYKLGTAFAIALRYEAAIEQLTAAEQTNRRGMEIAPRLAREHPKLLRRLDLVRLIAGARPPATPADHVELGRVRHREGRYADAAQEFERALADEALRKDLDQGCLYDAACAAARAVAAGDDSWRERALAWLGEDLRLLAAALTAADERLAGELEKSERDGLSAARAKYLVHLEQARTGNADLDALRGMPEFEALFVGLPGGE